jgi:4-aminobutyrate aminotransferase-like enzyme
MDTMGALLPHARELSLHAFERLAKIQTDHPTVGDVRGVGLMIGVELVKDPQDRVQDPDAFVHLQRYCLERDLIIIDCGPDGNIIRFIPALVTTREELDWAIDLIDAGLADYESK